MRGLNGRTYVVTGAASGIGRATAARLLRGGSPGHGGGHRGAFGRPRRRRRRGTVGLHPGRRDRRRLGRSAGAGRRGLRRIGRGPGQRSRSGRRRPGPPPARRRVGPGHRRQPDGDVPDRQARRGAAAGPAGPRRRPAGLGGDDRQHRGARGHGGRECLQRIQGGRRHPHQEHGHRLRRPWHPGQRHLPGVHRDADDGVGLRPGHGGGAGGHSARAQARSSHGPAGGDRRRGRLPALRRRLLRHRPRPGGGRRLHGRDATTASPTCWGCQGPE